jgi:hypothetical protein
MTGPGQDLYGGFSDRHDRLVVDRKIWEAARADGFEGARWDLLLETMVVVAHDRLIREISSHSIFERCRLLNPNVKLKPPARWNFQDHEDLAQDCIEGALILLRKTIIDGNGWDPDRGVTLAEYFVTMSRLCFPNAFQTWLRRERRNGLAVDNFRWQDDPQVIAVMRVQIDSIINNPRLPHSHRLALFSSAYGLTVDETAAQIGKTARAIEGMLRRSRQLLRRAKEVQQ